MCNLVTSRYETKDNHGKHKNNYRNTSVARRTGDYPCKATARARGALFATQRRPSTACLHSRHTGVMQTLRSKFGYHSAFNKRKEDPIFKNRDALPVSTVRSRCGVKRMQIVKIHLNNNNSIKTIEPPSRKNIKRL